MRLKARALSCVVFALAAMTAVAAPFRTSEFVALVPNEGRMVPATICLPEGGPGQTFPAVVMLHGTGSARDEAGNGYKLLAPYMAERGIASIRLDFAGSGDSKADYVEYTWTSGASDASACAAFMQRLKAVDPARIGVMGWSQGGSVAILAAARDPAFKSLLTWAGALDMSWYIKDQYAEAKARGFTKMAFEWRSPLNVSLAWFEDVRSISLASELRKFKGPVLAIAGTEDKDVPLAYLDAIVASAGGMDKAKLLIKGADHTFNIFTGDMKAFNELMDATTAFFLKKL